MALKQKEHSIWHNLLNFNINNKFAVSLNLIVDWSNLNITHQNVYNEKIIVSHSNTAKYPGITLDVKLKWKEHIKKKKKSLIWSCPKCISSLEQNPSCQQNTKFFCTTKSSNQLGQMVYSFGVAQVKRTLKQFNVSETKYWEWFSMQLGTYVTLIFIEASALRQ